MLSRAEAIGGRWSVLLGVPTGTVAVLATLAASSLLSGDSLFTVYLRFFGDATAWLLVVFPLALWAAGRAMARAIVERRDARATRRRYSLSVNAAIWLVYALVTVVSTTSQVTGTAFLISNLALPLVLCVVSVAFTPSTIARVIYRTVEAKLKRG